MAIFQDLSNRKFNNLTTTTKHETRISSGRSRVFWECKCDCGKEPWVLSTSLLTGHTKSCGCLSGANMKLPIGEAHKNAIFLQAKLGAKSRNIYWNLTKDQYFSISSNPCHYCGALPVVKLPSRKLNGKVKANGLDRVNSNKGYIAENCVSCCWLHNRMKGEMSLNDFILECKKITERFNVNTWKDRK